jgi:NAD(P)-dependent dehydrogenase (short-subunit alcohol dehydrogenase family)
MGSIVLTDYRKLFDLSGKIAVVLGAASGIGRASAEAIGAMGAHVVCADRDRDGVEATAAAIRAAGSAEAHQVDAASGTEVGALAASVLGRHARVDIAVTTPGLNIRKTVFDYTEADFDRVVGLNLKGTFHFFRAFGAPMVKRRQGSIIACSSVRAVTIEPGLAVYGSTKAAIGLLVQGFASEVGPFGVRVNAVAPSIVETALTAPFKERPDIHKVYGAHTALERWSQPWEVGTAVAFLASDAASYVTGSTLFVDGGWTAIDGPPTGLTQLKPSQA